MVFLCCLLLVALCSTAQHAIVLFDFTAREADELSVKRGDVVELLPSEESDEEWQLVQHSHSRSGLVPLNHLKVESAAAAVDGAPHDRAGVSARGEMQRVPDDLKISTAANESPAYAEGEYIDPMAADALRRYRSRQALYDGTVTAALKRWGVGLELESAAPQFSPDEWASGVQEAEPLEHRSGVGGVPFFNLVEFMEEAVLAEEIVAMLRAEWLPETGGDAQARLRGFDDALAAAAAPGSRDVILTFANLGYADFVLNGFAPSVVPHTLVVALDAEVRHCVRPLRYGWCSSLGLRVGSPPRQRKRRGRSAGGPQGSHAAQGSQVVLAVRG